MAANATGEAQTGPLRLQFDRSVKLAFRGSAISSDGGLLLHRELDDALGLTDMAATLISDPRTGCNGRHRLAGFRADAAFAIPALFDVLEAEGWDYAIRIKGNPKLHDRISWLTKRGPGRPPHHIVRRYTSFRYRAKSWSKPRRVVAKVEFHPGELFPTVGFIVTNRSLPNERACWRSITSAARPSSTSRRASTCSSGRGSPACASTQTPSGCSCTRWPTTWRTSCARWRHPRRSGAWSLTSLRERLVKTGARLVRHARYAVFQLAEAALPRDVFAGVLDRINGLRGPPAAAASA